MGFSFSKYMALVDTGAHKKMQSQAENWVSTAVQAISTVPSLAASISVSVLRI